MNRQHVKQAETNIDHIKPELTRRLDSLGFGDSRYKLDAEGLTNTGQLERELDYIKSRVFEVQYPEMKAMRYLPVSEEAPFGTKRIFWEEADWSGEAKIVADYAKDFPAAQSYRNEYFSKVYTLGASYNFTLEELAASQMAMGQPLDVRRSFAARRSIEQKMNKIGWFGDANYDLYGVLSPSQNIPRNPAANTGTGGNTEWSTKTPEQWLKDITDANSRIRSETKGVEEADTLLLPISQYDLIAQTPYSKESPTLTVLDYVLNRLPNISTVDWVAELEGAGQAGEDIFLLYSNNSRVLQYEIPSMTRQLDPEFTNMQIHVPMYAAVAGVSVRYPRAAEIVTGI